MAITLTGAQGLFTRLGHLIAGLNEHNAARGATLNARVTTVRGDFTSLQQDVLDGLYGDQVQWQGTDTWAEKIKALAQSTLTRMAQDDGWPGGTLAQALEYLRVQMKGAGTMLAPTSSILKPTVTVTTAAVAGNVGNGNCRASVVSPADGLALDYVIAEDNPIVCTAHGYPGGSATAGAETWAFSGDLAAPTVLSYPWPLGSGAAATLATVSTGGAGGVVTDGDFEQWNVNTPTSWTVVVGNPGVTILKGVAPFSAAGTFNLRLVGDGAVFHKVRQLVNVAPSRAYAVNWYNQVTAAPGAGSLRVRLEDVNGNPILDDSAQAGTNSLSTTLATMAAAYAVNGGWFYTPRILPSTGVYLSFEVTGTALAAGKNLDIDTLCCDLGVQVYNGGPFAAIFAGSVPFAVGDQFTLTTTNSFGTATLARGLDRLWDLRDNGVRLPSRAVGDGGTATNALVV